MSSSATLPDDLNRLLTAAARRRDSSRTEIIRQALGAFLNQERQAWPRSIGMARGRDLSATAENIKSVVRAEWRKH